MIILITTRLRYSIGSRNITSYRAEPGPQLTDEELTEYLGYHSSTLDGMADRSIVRRIRIGCKRSLFIINIIFTSRIAEPLLRDQSHDH